jgi:hypothetical protein
MSLAVSIACIASALLAGALLLLTRHIPLGVINGRSLRAPPEIDDARIGRSRGMPFAMRFRIDDQAAGFPGGIGRIAHRALFRGLPGFTLNVVYARARPNLRWQSAFADPRSIWHNVFVGYYQVDVSCAEWGRPFAYDLDGEGRPTIRVDELARLLKADWNHLSNQIYGVPEAVIRLRNGIDLEALGFQLAGRVCKEGWDGAWDLAELDNLDVVSPYSASRGRDYAPLGPVTALLWRLAFGTFDEPVASESFPTTNLRLRAYLSFRRTTDARGAPVYQTHVFGATINRHYDGVDPAENARFLDLQMRALEGLISRERGVGFAS